MAFIPDHPYRILIIGGSRSRKTNVLLNLIKYQQPEIRKIYLYVKDPFEKYQSLINGREKVGIKNLKNPKAFIDNSQKIDNIYENLEDYNPTKKKRVLNKEIMKNYLYFLAEAFRNIISFSVLYHITKFNLKNNFLCIKIILTIHKENVNSI